MYRIVMGMALALAFSGQAKASDDLEPVEEYNKKIQPTSVVSPLAGNVFGESVNLYDGSTSFHMTDIDIPGNNALPVRLSRSFDVKNRRRYTVLPGLADWELDVPRLYGEFYAPKGWIGRSASPYSRCSVPAIADAAMLVNGVENPATIHEIWHGYFMSLPGKGDQEMLVNTESKLPATQDGGVYPWITRDFTRLGCLASTKNYPGEGFYAITPDGTKYYFDYAISHSISAYWAGTDGGSQGTSKVNLVATRVEDRFGNWVKYHYSGALLTSIEASDGRLISLSYSNDRLVSASANGRTWNYSYEWTVAYPVPTGAYRLRSVQQPDASQWDYRIVSGSLLPKREPPPDGGQNTSCRRETDLLDGEFTLDVTHPSGASGVFVFWHSRRYRGHTPRHPCDRPLGEPVLTPYIPHFFDSYSLYTKTIAGPGLPSAVWRYVIGQGGISFYTSGGPNDPCPTCRPSKISAVIEPDGTTTEYEYGILYGLNEGRVLSTKRKDANGVVLSVSTNTYLADSDVAAQKFPAQAGSTLVNINNALVNLIRPIRAKTISQDGVDYNYQVDTACDGTHCFDAFARPTRATRSSPWNSRTDATEYHDNLTKWVLGQASKTTNVNTGLVPAETVFDTSTALPLQQKRFGKLQQTLTYNADGTLATVKDGNNNVTTLGSWKRGIPQTITYADNNSQSAVVDDSGWIRSVTDEIGAKTCYDYDQMGRLSRIDYPTETAGVCGGLWHPTTQVFEPVATPEWGVPAGHWRQTISTGYGHKVSYFDALWRPLLVAEYDQNDVGGTQHFSRFTYDHAGRATFAAYPSTSSAATTGVWTSYDALGRVRSVSQDSEHGPLTTLTDYLPNNQVRVTNPKGGQTTSSFQVFDQPSYDSPVMISHPEGAFTDISRDIFGKPIALIRRNADSSQSVTRHYVYDTYQQLCKTVEPETGATVMDYDNAGNLQWNAAGLSLVSTSSCDTLAARDSGHKVTWLYDVRNRVEQLLFPNGLGNQVWTYTPDGLPAQITTHNSNGGDPVINAYGYNKRRMLTSENVTQPGAYSWALNYGYDTHGALASLSYPSGLQVSFAPNALGQPTQAGSYATGVSYYPNGAIKQFTYGNGIVHTMTQNDRQLPLQVRSGNVTGYEYWYDKNANPTHLHDLVQGSNYSRLLEYDGLDRLTGAGSASFGGDHWHRFTYDALDNLKSWKLAGIKDYANYYYEPATNRLLSIQNSANATIVGLSYGERGNLRNKNGQQYVFDFGNRMREAVGKETYRYDGHGRRVQSSSAAQGNILSMYGQDGVLRRQEDARLGKNTEFVYLGGSLVARVNVAVAPGVPVLTAPGYSTQASYTVQWSAVPSISRYELQEQANGGAWQAAYSGAAVSQAIGGKTSGVYGYRVRACNPSACGGWSGVAAVTVELPPSTVPTLSLPGSSYSGSYTATWSASAGATTYQLEESANGGAWTAAYNGAATSQAYSGRAAGSYAYRVRACNPAGCSGYSGTAAITVLYAPASAPSVSSPGFNNTGSYSISWTTVANATRYQLEESALGGGWTAIYNSSGTSIPASGKTAGNYAYRATACNAAGCGPTSATVTTSVVLPPTAAPSASVPGSNVTGSYTVSWSVVGAATGYHVWERVNGGNWVSVYDAAPTSMSVSGKANATYGYVVRGCNAGGCGPWSAEVSTVVNVPPAIPATPTGLTAIRDFDDTTTPGTWAADVNWQGSYGATRYELQQQRGTTVSIAYNGPSTWVRIPRVGTTAALTYWIRACSANGCSAWSAPVSL